MRGLIEIEMFAPEPPKKPASILFAGN